MELSLWWMLETEEGEREKDIRCLSLSLVLVLCGVFLTGGIRISPLREIYIYMYAV